MVTDEAFNILPKIDALKSLPSLFKVVATPSFVEATYPVINKCGNLSFEEGK